VTAKPDTKRAYRGGERWNIPGRGVVTVVKVVGDGLVVASPGGGLMRVWRREMDVAERVGRGATTT
jgi:hypothetical protein